MSNFGKISQHKQVDGYCWELAPNVEAKVILDKLMEKHPNEFCKSHLRTLQRRVSELRAKESQREKKYEELMVKHKYMTTATIPAMI
jgi:hypothetical protein